MVSDPTVCPAFTGYEYWFKKKKKKRNPQKKIPQHLNLFGSLFIFFLQLVFFKSISYLN